VNSQMRISSVPVATAKPTRPAVLSALRRHIAAIVLVSIFAAGLALALSLALSPPDPGHLGLSDIPTGAWTR
jgi:hypothetical protein